jgi:Protein of unknown function (DUF2877)
MIQRASSVGELALELLSRGGRGTVTRAFEHSAYVGAGSDFILLLWGDGRSPMTINVRGADGAPPRGGEECELSPSGVRTRQVTVAVKGARVYRSSLRTAGEVAPPALDELVKGVAMLKSLYDASPHGPALISDPLFQRFVRRRLGPAAGGTRRLEFNDFLGLVGRGGGFTPAGDDFAAGFTAVFNYIARSRGSRQIVIPKAVASRTVPESAAIMVYSSQGYVDEGVQRLILDSLGGRGFSNDVMSLASRGHTSGMDMSLGALLAEGVESGKEDRGRALQRCIEILWAD